LEHGTEASPWLFFGFASLVAVGLALFSIISTRKLEKVPTSRRQTFLEVAILALNNFVVDTIGPGGEKYTPFVGTLFIFILCMNLLGLIPFLKSPTSNLSITAGLALVVFVFYNYAGIREAGLKAWFMHLLGEPLWLAPLMFPIHVVGELARPLSLAIRLYGNIFGEETVIAMLATMTFFIIPKLVAFPTQFPMLLFAIFTAFVQALVFSVLTSIYISIAISSAHHEH
jgi:F-type H+-transporting ATPase subunit a